MTDDNKSGSLGFFSSYDDLSDSSSDSDEEGDCRKKKAEKEAEGSGSQTSAKRTAGGAALPRPDELFSSVSKPAFLYNPLNKEIDWDTLTVKPPEEPAREFKPWTTNAVPPPESYAVEPEKKKKAPPPGMDMAIKWSSVYEDNGADAPRAYSGKAQFLPPEEQQIDSDEESQQPSLSAKKRRVETFQQKEKRKRDLGQATSDKNFVEEEKRILRQKAE